MPIHKGDLMKIDLRRKEYIGRYSLTMWDPDSDKLERLGDLDQYLYVTWVDVKSKDMDYRLVFVPQPPGGSYVLITPTDYLKTECVDEVCKVVVNELGGELLEEKNRFGAKKLILQTAPGLEAIVKYSDRLKNAFYESKVSLIAFDDVPENVYKELLRKIQK